jgi:hypothetical protein
MILIISATRTATPSSYLTTGVNSSVTATVLTAQGSPGWGTNDFAGMILVPNTTYVQYSYKIASNTANTIMITGILILPMFRTPDLRHYHEGLSGRPSTQDGRSSERSERTHF